MPQREDARFTAQDDATSPGKRMLLRSSGGTPDPADREMPDAVADEMVVAGSDSSGNEMPDEIPDEKPDAAARERVVIEMVDSSDDKKPNEAPKEKPDAAARDD